MKKAEKLDSDENSTHAKNRHYSTGGSVVTADIVMKANHKILNRFWESRRFLRRGRRISSPTGSNPCPNESPYCQLRFERRITSVGRKLPEIQHSSTGQHM